ncbi:HAD-superfamily hydrolase, subfamily IIB [Palleronia marisminoris]|uniref:Mannosylfructose-phosphate phosphatase n=1 Tax=Palleronia marisminoris TaxID=315423 RepID=A0A1Y5RTA3_9RHOB|nr:HAD-IIB family hydrolase [Palleronia marisminoris]SFG50487.1 HAD-superfamily hydrolase, subfamily IIB [Palleronia marisminoris]SLN24655.1 Mannosylfructose-phosphate phosphatase [Palleronia marisminoris]
MSETLDRDIGSCKFVLATDLDGTFLGGSEEDRKTLYDWIEANRETIGLIFVTGRDPEFIAALCDGGVPWPEYVVGDVGTTIAKIGNGALEPIPALESDIAEAWDNAGDRVRSALDGKPGLTLQPTEFRYRVSYDMDPDMFDRSAIDAVEEMGFDWIASDGKYFDVLPKGISKGPSLKKLVSHLGVPPNAVLAAGDTLNDLSMLECGLPAVAVGGSEASLVERVQPLPHVYIAKAVGAAGILEAVQALDLHETPGADASDTQD